VATPGRGRLLLGITTIMKRTILFRTFWGDTLTSRVSCLRQLLPIHQVEKTVTLPGRRTLGHNAKTIDHQGVTAYRRSECIIDPRKR